MPQKEKLLQFFSTKYSSITISQTLCVVLFILVQLTYSQEHNQNNINFLSQDSFEELSSAYNESKENISIAKSFALAFLLKAKQEKDSLKQAEGYYMVAENLTKGIEYNRALPYLDSTVTYSKDNYTYKFPARAHILKANINGAQANFTEAMDQLTIANSYAIETNNIDQQYGIKYFIALLKNNIGEYDEGLLLLKETITYRKNKFIKDSKYRDLYLISLFAVGNQFNLLRLPDSSLYYTKKAIDISLKTENKLFYDRMVLNSAISYNLKKKYLQSLDSLLKYEKIVKTKESSVGSVIRAGFYFGEAYYKLGKKEIALEYLKRIDSLAFKENYFFPGIESNYELLIDYHKNKGDSQEQLLYINKLLYVDSILDNDLANLSKKLYHNYDTPNIIQEKQRLIKKLENKNATSRFLLFIISFIAVVLIVLLIWYYRKQSIYKKRFEELLQRDILNNVNAKQITEISKSEIDISEEIIQDVLTKLVTFESKLGFLKLNLTVGALAKEFNTNSKYFSKIINTYKEKSFTNYINELRINYVVEELKTNSKYRKYTIKALANEIGFNTTEAFSKSFYKTTGIYPSYFIKQLEKNR